MIAPVKNLLQIYADATEIMQHGVMWLNEEGQILHINTQFARELGYAKTDFTLRSKTIFQVSPYLNFMTWRTHWNKLLSTKQIEIDLEHMAANGNILPMKLRGILMDVGEQMVCCAILENRLMITPYLDLLQMLSELLKAGGWQWTLTSDTYFLTQEMYRMLELPDNFSLTPDNIEQILANYLPAEDFFSLKEKIEETIKTGKSFESEISINIPSLQQTRQFWLRAVPYQVEGHTIKIYGTLQDINTIAQRTEEMYVTEYVLNHAPNLIYWFDYDGKIQYVNDTTCALLGYTRAELLQMDIRALLTNYTPESWAEGMEMYKAGKTLRGNSELRLKDGAIMPISFLATHINYRDQALVCVFVENRSEHVQQRQLIEMTRHSLNQSHDLIYWIDAEGNFIYVNDIMCKKLGYTRKELQQMRLVEVAKDFNQSQYDAAWADLSIAQEIKGEITLCAKNGKCFPVNYHISLVNFEGKLSACGVLTDISELKQIEKEIAQNSALIQSRSYALNNATDIIYWVRPDGSFVYVNDTFCEKTACSRAELPKVKLPDFFPEFSFADFEAGWQKLREGKVLESELVLTNRKGKRIPVKTYITLADYQGEEACCGILRDVTETKQKEQELRRALDEISQLKEQVELDYRVLKEEIEVKSNFNYIISKAKAYKKVLKQVEQVADTDATVLITGETGTGKELLARALHQLSSRAGRPMVKINCGALPETLIESELFGHEKGAFTGAYQQKKGRFEMADKGTIFLDEIGELPLELQAKLLRVLQEGEFERVGGTQTLKVDVRVVAATNRNLEQQVQEGKFRQDLYYRLNVFPIHNLPLRERREDIPLLVRHFVDKFTEKRKNSNPITNIPGYALEKLMHYDFPGNVRELENIVERAVILSTGDTLKLDTSFFQSAKNAVANNNFKTLEEMQREHILEALRRTNGQVSGDFGAAKILDINDKTLASRMKKLNISRRDYISES